MAVHFATLIDVVEHRAHTHAHAPIHGFIGADDAITAPPFGELFHRGLAVAGALQQIAEPGDRVLLLLPPGLDVIVGLLASLLAGTVCVPLPVTGHRRVSFAAQALDAGARVALGDRATIDRLRSHPDAAGLRWLALDEPPPAAAYTRPTLAPDDLAWLQYTSGSTGTPRGVMVRHRNAIANSSDIAAAWGLGPDSRSLMWVPHYHDDGLVHAILQPLYTGFQATLMSPLAFIQRPARWLQRIGELRATHAGGPNFAYEVCLRKLGPGEREGLDLSSWTVAYNAAEPVRAATLRRFHATFAACGLRWSALRPAYGMAETTLLVTTSAPDDGPVIATLDGPALRDQGRARPAETPARAVDCVSSGRVIPTSRMVIRDPDTGRVCNDDEVGEIVVQGPGVAAGYWRRPPTEAFHLEIPGEPGTWLCTGDLGFLRDGELFVTGRRKDLIILAGANYYPQDIEAAIEASDPAFRPGCTAAFGVELPELEEGVVVVAEVPGARPGDAARLAPRAQAAVGEALGLRLEALVLLPPETLPKTTSGKVRRQPCRSAWLADELPTLDTWRRSPAVRVVPPVTPTRDADLPVLDAWRHSAPVTPTRDADLRATITDTLANHLGVAASELDPDAPFSALGLRSLDAAAIADTLARALGRPLTPLHLFEHPSIAALARHLGAAADPRPAAIAPRPAGEPAAIVGLACRFPGADDPDAFWRLLAAGDDAITPVSESRWRLWEEYDRDIRSNPRLALRHGGFCGDIDRFDAAFFAISPREAAYLDPQQRWALELCWEALEDAGIPPDSLAGSRTGVFVGAIDNEYGRRMFSHGLEAMVDAYSGTGGALSIIANRISYLLDLHGPSLTLDTACSSSLVALHLALASLRRGDCDLALVVGTNLMLTPGATLMFSLAGALSRTGRSRPFDADADGFVRSEGAGALVLKLLPRADADGDRVRALVRGTAVVQDGRTNGIMAPSRAAQETTLRAALADAGVDPTSVTLVEAHGTGTPLGDPIEASALAAVYGPGRARPLWLGAAKANLGHLEGAAGIVGLIKTTLSLERRQIPPLAHWRAPNPLIAMDTLRAPTELTPWDGPLVAGVSSFGFGGTNAHAILSAAAADESPAARLPTPRPWLLPLSARSPEALVDLAARWRLRLQDAPASELPDLCFTAAVRRAHYPHRLAVLGDSPAALALALAHATASGPVRAPAAPLLLLSGHGSQWVGMPGELPLPAAEAALAAALAAIRGFGPFAWPLTAADLDQVARVQPAIFAVQVALAAAHEALGVAPAAVLGHSMGEVAAAYIAGALSLTDAARVIVERSRLLATVEGDGAMLAVPLPATALDLADDLSIAVDSGPDSVVVAGPPAAIAALHDRLAARGIDARPVRTRVAFHSPQMDPLTARLAAALQGITPRSARVPLWSTVTGARVDGRELGPDYWAQNLRAPVRFGPAVRAALAALPPGTPLAELAPHPLLAAPCRGLAPFIPSLHRDEPPLAALAALYRAGYPLAWRALYPHGRVAHVPTYPWQRQRHWLELPAARGRPARSFLGRPAPLALGETRRFLHDLSQHPWLADHRLGDAILVPGSVALEAALAAGEQVLGGPVALHDVRFESPFFPGAPPWNLELSVTGSADGLGFLASGPSGPVARGRITLAAPTVPPAPAVTCPHPLPAARFYADLQARGLAYGPAFQGVRALALGEDVVEAELTAPDEISSDLASALAHPAVLDAALHFVAAALLASDAATWLPVGLAHLHVAAPLRGRLRATARITRAPGSVHADIWLSNSGGAPIAFIQALEVRQAAGHDDRLYEVVWEPAPPPAPTLVTPAIYLIATPLDPHATPTTDGSAALAPRLADALRARGATVAIGLPPASRPLLADRPADLIVDLRPLDLPEPTALASDDPPLVAAVARAVHDAVRLFTALPAGTLVSVLRDRSPSAAAIAGATRCARWERPDLTLACLHLAADTPTDAIAAALIATDREPDVRVDPDGRAVRRLARARHVGAASPHMTGPIVISGGLGALGLIAAEELARRGAPALILIGRSAPTPDITARLATLRARGCAVDIIQADISDAAALRAALGERRIAGVIHSAGALDDAPLAELDLPRITRVLAPKLQGALALHRLAQGAEFFVLFASVAGLWGNPRQTAYAAANAALDAFASWRRAHALPAVSLAWGPWSEVGMAARSGALRWAAAQGLGALAPDEGAALLGRLLLAGPAQLGVFPFTWSRQDGAADPFLARLAPRSASADMTPASAVREAVAAAFQLPADRLDLDLSLTELGLDSVVALDLRTRISRTTGVDLPVQDLLRGPTLRALVERVTSEAPVTAADIDALSDTEVDALLTTLLARD